MARYLGVHLVFCQWVLELVFLCQKTDTEGVQLSRVYWCSNFVRDSVLEELAGGKGASIPLYVEAN